MASWADRPVEKFGDWLSKQVERLPVIGTIAAIFWAQRQPDTHRARQASDQFLNWLGEQTGDFINALGHEWNRFRVTLQWLTIGTLIAAALALLVGLATSNRLTKVMLEILIGLPLSLGYAYAYFYNWRPIVKMCAAAGFIISGKRISVHLNAIDEAMRDYGAAASPELAALRRVTNEAFGDTGSALKDAITTFQNVGISIFQRPMRIVSWFVAGQLFIVIVDFHHHPLLWGLGVLNLALLLPGILAWSKEQRTKDPISRRLLRISGWLILFAILGVSFIPEAAQWIYSIQSLYMGPAAQALHDKLLWHNTKHLRMVMAVILVYSFLEFAIFPTVGNEGAKNKVRGAAGIGVGFVLVSFFALGALVQAHSAFANAYEGGSWRTRGYLVGLVVALFLLVVKAFNGKWKQALVVVAVLFVGSCLYSRSSGHRGLWGAQFDYDAFARAQAKIQAKPDIAPVEPAPKSLMLPSWDPPAGWTPDGKRSAATNPTPHRSASVAQASVLPVPTVPVVDDTLRQVLSPGMTPWRFKLPPGVYRIKYTGRMLYTTARPVYEWRNGQQVLVYPMVDSTGGKIPVSRRFRPQDYPMPDGMEGDPYIRFFDNPRVYHKLSGTNWDPITIPHEVVAEVGQNVDLDWPIWEGNGSLLVTIVKVY